MTLPAVPQARLAVTSLNAGYAKTAVVRDIDFTVNAGEVLTVLGPNGAGKTTTLLTIAGLIPWLEGGVSIDGHHLRRGSAVAASRRGVVLVPDDRALFTSLTTRENLFLGRRKGSMSIEEVVSYLPALQDRLGLKAGVLSGGEQQMLAVARGLIQRPRVLMIDELSMGLAPVVVQSLLPVIRRIATETQTAVVLVEQHARLAIEVADQALVLVHGDVALTGAAADLRADMTALEHAYLGDGAGAAPAST